MLVIQLLAIEGVRACMTVCNHVYIASFDKDNNSSETMDRTLILGCAAAIARGFHPHRKGDCGGW